MIFVLFVSTNPIYMQITKNFRLWKMSH